MKDVACTGVGFPPKSEKYIGCLFFLKFVLVISELK